MTYLINYEFAVKYRLNLQQANVYGALCSKTYISPGKSKPWNGSINGLARDMEGLISSSSVARCVRELEEKGLIRHEVAGWVVLVRQDDPQHKHNALPQGGTKSAAALPQGGTSVCQAATNASQPAPQTSQAEPKLTQCGTHPINNNTYNSDIFDCPQGAIEKKEKIENKKVEISHPTKQEAAEYGKERNIPIEVVARWWYWWEERGWVNDGKPLGKWQASLEGYALRGNKNESKSLLPGQQSYMEQNEIIYQQEKERQRNERAHMYDEYDSNQEGAQEACDRVCARFRFMARKEVRA